MMQIARFIFYSLSILLIGYLYSYSSELIHSFEVMSNSHLMYFLIVAFPMSIGILLGLIGFVSKPQTDKLKYDWILALGLGIPLGYLTFQPLLFRINIVKPALQYSFNYPIAGIIFGYVLIAAIKGVPFRIFKNSE